MKKRICFLTLFIFLAALPAATVTNAQEKVSIEKSDNAQLLTVNADVDSTGLTVSTVTSDWFSANKFLGNSFNTYPVTYTKKLNSAKGKPRVTTTIEGTNDQVNIAAVDTVGILADSLETYQSGTLNLNNKKYWYYRIKHVGTTGNRADVTSSLDLLFTKP